MTEVDVLLKEIRRRNLMKRRNKLLPRIQREPELKEKCQDRSKKRSGNM